DQRVGAVPKLAPPRTVLDPSELPVGPDAEALEVPVRVVEPPDVGVIQVANAVEPVERDQPVAISDGDVVRQDLPRGGRGHPTQPDRGGAGGSTSRMIGPITYLPMFPGFTVPAPGRPATIRIGTATAGA